VVVAVGFILAASSLDVAAVVRSWRDGSVVVVVVALVSSDYVAVFPYRCYSCCWGGSCCVFS
jgi:hypothetical protein